MSWERMSETKDIATCSCGAGIVEIIRYRDGDDWNRLREGILKERIECKECKDKYHIEHIYSYYNCLPWKGNGEIDTVYLVPNDLTLQLQVEKKRLPFENSCAFDENAVAKFPKEDLASAIIDMKCSKFSTRLHEECSKELVHMYYKVNKQKKLSMIIPVLNMCIENYESYEWNYPKVKKFREEEEVQICKNKELMDKNLKQSFELKFYTTVKI